jgi:class 3 adenylate cyclase
MQPPPPLTDRQRADHNLGQRHRRERLLEAQPRISCPSCGHNNRPDRRFCTECGRRVGRACAACGMPTEEEQKFCGNCGAPLGERVAAARAPAAYTPKHLADRILAERAAMESRGAQDGERKTITALFADIKGSVEMMEGLDPEEARAIVDPALKLMMDAVHRYEGYVAQSRGDGIFALFGAPIAQEDHARRALYAALRTQEEIKRYSDRLRIEKGVPLAIRVGLNSGEMVLRAIRKDDLHTDYVPIGHSVNLAARMESLATPGSIAVAESTFRATQGYFRFRELGPVAVKGVSEAVRVYELEGIGALRTRLEVSRSRGFSRFVGRQDETAALEAALARAIGGSAQVVGIVGEPGVGKSRLCFEFLERCRARGLPIFEAQGVPHGKALPLLPMLELSGASSASRTRTPTRPRGKRSPEGFCFSTRACARSSLWSSISSACLTRSVRPRCWTRRAASASSLPWSSASRRCGAGASRR